MAVDQLRTYLTDHLAGSVAAVNILDRLMEASDTSEEREFVTRLRGDIEADRSTLESLLEQIGGNRGIMREAGAWAAEKLLTVKLRFDDPAGRGLDLLEALEMLALGILGKRALWQALATVADEVPQLKSLDLARLEARAVDQHDRVNARRLEAARRVLRGSPEPAASRPG